MPPKGKSKLPSKRPNSGPSTSSDGATSAAEEQREGEPSIPRLSIYTHPQGNNMNTVLSITYNMGIAVKPMLSACQDIGLHITLKVRGKY